MHRARSPTSILTDYVHRHFTESCKIFTGNATINDDSTDGYNPSAFVGNPKLPTESPTDDANSKRRALIHLCPHALADGITKELRKIWSVIKNFWREIQNLPMDFRNITDGIIKINII
jgi:hypothetical protein